MEGIVVVIEAEDGANLGVAGGLGWGEVIDVQRNQVANLVIGWSYAYRCQDVTMKFRAAAEDIPGR